MVFSLLLNEAEKLPIFAEKGGIVEITGSMDNLSIKGDGENLLLNEMMNILRSCPKQTLNKTVDSLIKANNSSFTCLYLIEKYDGESDSPNLTLLKERIEGLSGKIKDTPYMISIQGKINQLSNKNSSIYSLPGQDREGNNIKWTSIMDQYILVSFWASWHPESVQTQDSLESVLKELEKEDFIICSVSLDVDKEAWLQASDRKDSKWYQVCDFKGWNNPIVKAQGIQTLPYNILLEPNKRILDKNIKILELEEKVKEHQERNNKKENNQTLKEIIITGSASRVRPILMTTLTTMLGVVPMAMAKGEGAEIYAPLGQAISGGLLTSTIITLFIIPVLYFMTEKNKQENKFNEDIKDEN